MLDLVKLSGRTKTTLVQKVLDIDKAKPEKLKWPMLFSEKIDGVYCLALKYDYTVTIYSRTGEVYVSMKHIENQLSYVMSDGDIVIFEAYEPNTAQSVISGHCRDTKAQHPELTAYCHQYIAIEEFVHGGENTFKESYEILCDMMSCTDIEVIHQILVYSLDEAMELTKFIWANGGEGSILRNPNGVFQGGKRNDNVLRIKQGESYDLMVVGRYPGKGKYTGMVGGIICRFKDDKFIAIGTGLSDAQRKLWWDHPEEIDGFIVQIDAMRGSSKGKLREPRFKGIRYDKDVADF